MENRVFTGLFRQMRIVFWTSVLLLAFFISSVTQARDSVKLFSGGSISYSTKGTKTRLVIRLQKGVCYVLSVQRDSTVSSKAKPMGLMVVGELGDSAIILVDTYPSIPDGMSYCQAGEERFLRIISISKKQAEETFRVKLESCRENIELASPGIEWLPETSMLRISWLQGPTKKQKPEELTLRIRPDGKPE